jgi:hypothetical protein
VWRSHLGATEEDFEKFVRTLHFDLGSTCFQERLERARDQMEERGFKHDDAALLVTIGIIRNWVKAGCQEVTREVLEDVIRSHDLAASEDVDKCVTILLTTVKKQRIDIRPGYIVDWRDRFEGPIYEKGHAVHSGVDWNRDLMPELRDIEIRVSEETGCRLVRARGLARLSAWFGFGRTFCESARYTIEVDQQGSLWRSDASSTDFALVRSNGDGEAITGDRQTVAVGISVTSSLENAVRGYLSETKSASNLLFLEPNRPLSHDCLGAAGDAVALSRQAKEAVKRFAARHRAKKTLLFYLGPLSGACFIRHVANALETEVHLMEFLNPGYMPSVLL